MSREQVYQNDIEQWLTFKIANCLKQNPHGIDREQPLISFGFDSLHLQSLFAEIEDTFLITIDDSFILNQENITELSQSIYIHITDQNINPNLEIATIVLATSQPDDKKIDYSIYTDFKQFPPYQQLKKMQQALGNNIFFDKQEGIASDTCVIQGKKYINFTSYNYLGLNNHPTVLKAAIDATKKYGTSVSASRLVSGEKVIHQQLEQELANFIGVDDAIVFNTGHATNVSTIAHLYGPDDLILHDELAHNSLILGAVYSQATRMAFPHNDWQTADNILRENRHHYKRVLIILEGIYSMDGDIPNLTHFINIKNSHGAWLMVDEAHSLGVLGKRGKGISEHFNINPNDIEIWMGTLSKSLASIGGYIAGKKELIEYLKFTCPGFIFSVGISPASTAAALTALEVLRKEPQRVAHLQELSTLARETALHYGFDIGLNNYTPILPIIIGDSKKCISISKQCMKQGINVKPIIYPAVPDNLARLRFFISTKHKQTQIKKAFATLAAVVQKY
ncbi:aminotransferase class I/II-fold pyridoxal phosphate-dependent enzyme [Legionella gresilensis]|uniref:aminotransferase class I/II-fold pyridoxal phosphate-dependent enzyme n=1 Tax=Legionella gresilensis TaxID=91823 RepID=UPI0010411441|nr:aminotransferase class I/II-fold pyridoxal phosphate-dependent enzyme [Legionella gresilensis]